MIRVADIRRRGLARIALDAGVAATLVSPSIAQGQTEDHKLSASNGGPYQQFGWSVSIDDAGVGIGSNFDNGTGSGRAFVFDTALWQPRVSVSEPEFPISREFASEVAIHAGVLVVGDPWGDGFVARTGAVYLFDAATGDPIFKLCDLNGNRDDEFGTSIAMDGNLVAISALGEPFDNRYTGSVSVFDVRTGVMLHKVFATDVDPLIDAESLFGWSIDLDGDRLLISMNWANAVPGTVYVYDLAAQALVHEIRSPLNRCVVSDGDLIAIGAPEADGAVSKAGAVFIHDAQTGVLLDTVFADDGAASSRFGSSIALENGILVVGAPEDLSAGDEAGAVYVFDVRAEKQLAKLTASDPVKDAWLGFDVDLEGELVVAGAPGARGDSGWSHSGAVYVYNLAGLRCAADLNADGFLDSGDLIEFVGLFLAGDMAADVNADGFLDSGDIAEFVDLFLAGC